MLDPFESVLEALEGGKMIILVDDASRENEGDLVALSSTVTADQIAFMMTHARGLICASVEPKCAKRLHLPLQSTLNLSPFDTPFAVSIDLKSNALRGVEAKARVETIRHLCNPKAAPDDFVSPGSVYPLIAHPKGVLGRRGQTEGSYDLARIVGKDPSGVICEILNEDGTMARGSQITEFAKIHDLKITSVEAILQYRIKKEPFFQITAVKEKEISGAQFSVYIIEDDLAGKEHIFLFHKAKDNVRPLVRIHSECLTGDVFGSRRCDCGPQLDLALQAIIERGYGALAYLRQEGRGIGLANKIKAYNLQDSGLDTVDANLELGFQADVRDYRLASRVFQSFDLEVLDILTNNPRKVEAMKESFRSVERIPIVAGKDAFNAVYLETKRTKMGHLF